MDSLKGSPKSMTFDDDEIANLLFYQYGQPYTYSALALLYPSLDFRNKFHLDHIFPKRNFTRRRLEALGIPEEKIDFYLDNYNTIVNLQLLEGVHNQERLPRTSRPGWKTPIPIPWIAKRTWNATIFPTSILALRTSKSSCSSAGNC